MNVYGLDEQTCCIQQIVSGTGRFNGAQVGYATYSYNNTAQFTVRARQWGTASNVLNVQLVDPGGNIPASRVTFDPGRKALVVFLRKVAGSITATAAEVVDKINAFRFNSGAEAGSLIDTIQPGVNGSPFLAGLITDGVLAAVALTALSGGVDPDVTTPGMYKFTPTANTHAGLFYFDQKRPVYVSSVTGRLSTSPIDVKVYVANVTPALNQIAAQECGIWEPTTADNYFALEDMKTPIMPGQALVVTCAAAVGFVRVTWRTEGVRSYL